MNRILMIFAYTVSITGPLILAGCTSSDISVIPAGETPSRPYFIVAELSIRCPSADCRAIRVDSCRSALERRAEELGVDALLAGDVVINETGTPHQGFKVKSIECKGTAISFRD